MFFNAHNLGNAHPAGRQNGQRGFTLVEILATMFVLVIGLASVLSVVLASTRSGQAASDRNNAVVMIPEALADIERMLLVTPQLVTQYPFLKSPHDYTGEYMDTMNLDNPAQNPFAGIPLPTYDANGKNNHSAPYKDLGYVNNAVPVHNLSYWPLDKYRSRTMGQFPAAEQLNPLLTPFSTAPNASPTQAIGLAYRGLFKLEPHPDWYISRGNYNDASPYAGVFVLTLTLYRDLSPGTDTTVRTQTTLNGVTVSPKQLIQVTDPVVVLLKKKIF